MAAQLERRERREKGNVHKLLKLNYRQPYDALLKVLQNPVQTRTHRPAGRRWTLR